MRKHDWPTLNALLFALTAGWADSYIYTNRPTSRYFCSAIVNRRQIGLPWVR